MNGIENTLILPYSEIQPFQSERLLTLSQLAPLGFEMTRNGTFCWTLTQDLKGWPKCCPQQDSKWHFSRIKLLKVILQTTRQVLYTSDELIRGHSWKSEQIAVTFLNSPEKFSAVTGEAARSLQAQGWSALSLVPLCLQIPLSAPWKTRSTSHSSLCFSQ